jgi:hypothetical protein
MLKSPRLDSALRWLERLLRERFGHNFLLLNTDRGLEMRLHGRDGSIIFDTECVSFSTPSVDIPFTIWDASKEGWLAVLGTTLPAPGVDNLSLPLIEPVNEDFIIHYDLLGLAYWMLCRVEEIGKTDLDQHDRFPGLSSHAYINGYLDRPIVDEWFHILGQVIQRKFRGLKLASNKFSMQVSHDVDRPSRYGFASTKNLVRRIIGDAVRGNIASAISGPLIRYSYSEALHPLDTFNTFDWLMDQSDLLGLTSSFNFIAGSTSPLDGEYDIGHPSIRRLLRKIHMRGHEIGLHPSYNTFNNANRLRQEAERLVKVCSEEGINQLRWGGRMHYLRWSHPDTLKSLANADIDYDGTLTFPDQAGFRCGTCFEYPAFDPVEGQEIGIRIRPLIVMEGTVLSKLYMGADKTQAFEIMKDLKEKCRAVGGTFSLLWHNSELQGNTDLYVNVLAS